jgi:hypothetical protein
MDPEYIHIVVDENPCPAVIDVTEVRNSNMCNCARASVDGIHGTFAKSQSRFISVGLLSRLRVIKARNDHLAESECAQFYLPDLNLSLYSVQSWGAGSVTTSEML